MVNAIRLLFNLRPGELSKSFLFIILGFLWSIGTYGSFTLSEGMFLEHVGAQSLPLTYIVIATSLCLLSTILIISLNRLPIRHILFLLISVWSVVIFTFYALQSFCHHSQGFWFAFKVFGWIMPISTYICYWAFIDQYIDLQDGKRLFGLFNAVTFLGDASGGGIISFGIGHLGAQGVLLLFGTVVVSSLPFVWLISHRVKPLLEEHVDHIDTRSTLSLKAVAKILLRSKFTLFLLSFYFLMQLLAIVTEYSYMFSFEHAFEHRQPGELTKFLGTCNMWVSLGNVLCGMFAYSRLVRWMGVQNLVMVAPSFFLLLFSVWFWQEGVPIAIFGLIAREGMVYTFDDNNLNLLISGVPTKIKNQVRITVESFFEPFGILFSSLLLFAFHKQSHLLGLIVSCIAVTLVLFLRATYAHALFNNLIASSIRFGKKAIEWIPKKEKQQFEFYLLASLKRSDEESQLLAFEYLIKMNNLKHLPHLLHQINLLSFPGKLRAIELISESSWAKEPSVIERLERWRRTMPHPAIKSSIHFYFARHALMRPERVMHDLHNEHVGLRAAAILSLKTTPYATGLPSFLNLASEKLHQLLESKIDQEICFGLEILGAENTEENFKRLLGYLKHPSLKVSRAAAKSLAVLSSPQHHQFAPTLISHLLYNRDSPTRLCCLSSIEKMHAAAWARELVLASVHFRPNERAVVERILLEHSSALQPLLVELLKDRQVHERCRLLAGKVLAKSDPLLLKNHLSSLLQVEIERAHFYYYHSATLHHHKTSYDLSILGNALNTGYHSVIDFIIQLLGAANALEESDVLAHSLRSKNRKIRAQAIETLQKACHSQLFALLEPLIDERSVESRLTLYLKKGYAPLNLMQLLDVMVHSPALTDQIVAIGLKAKLNAPGWREILMKKLHGTEEIFHHFAHELLASNL